MSFKYPFLISIATVTVGNFLITIGLFHISRFLKDPNLFLIFLFLIPYVASFFAISFQIISFKKGIKEKKMKNYFVLFFQILLLVFLGIKMIFFTSDYFIPNRIMSIENNPIIDLTITKNTRSVITPSLPEHYYK